MKELLELLAKLPKHIPDYLRVFLQTLSEPYVAFPPKRDEKRLVEAVHKGERIGHVDPNLIYYSLASVAIGLLVQAPMLIVRGQPAATMSAMELAQPVVLALVLWVGLALMFAALLKPVFGCPHPTSTLFSGSLQLYATIYVLSNVISLVAVLLISTFWRKPPHLVEYTYAAVHGPLLLIYFLRAGYLWRAEALPAKGEPRSLGSLFMDILKAIGRLIIVLLVIAIVIAILVALIRVSNLILLIQL